MENDMVHASHSDTYLEKNSMPGRETFEIMFDKKVKYNSSTKSDLFCFM